MDLRFLDPTPVQQCFCFLLMRKIILPIELNPDNTTYVKKHKSCNLEKKLIDTLISSYKRE